MPRGGDVAGAGAVAHPRRLPILSAAPRCSLGGRSRRGCACGRRRGPAVAAGAAYPARLGADPAVHRSLRPQMLLDRGWSGRIAHPRRPGCGSLRALRVAERAPGREDRCARDPGELLPRCGRAGRCPGNRARAHPGHRPGTARHRPGAGALGRPCRQVSSDDRLCALESAGLSQVLVQAGVAKLAWAGLRLGVARGGAGDARRRAARAGAGRGGGGRGEGFGTRYVGADEDPDADPWLDAQAFWYPL